MVRSFLTSGSSKTFTASGSVSGSPGGVLTGMGLSSPCAAASVNVLATVYNATGSGTAGTELWTLSVPSGNYASKDWAIPVRCPNGIYISVIGAGSAMLSWAL